MVKNDLDEGLLLDLLKKEERERVAPKFEPWRKPATYKAACGGRGAGAKSTSVAKLLIQKLQYRPRTRWFCGREKQNSLEESSFSLIWDTIQELQYEGWERIPSRSTIRGPNESYFHFGGFGDIKAAKSKKSFSKYHGCWIDEAEDITMDVWDIIIPTFVREIGSEMWVTFNRHQEMDAAYRLFFVDPPPDTISVELRPGKLDNPWFPETLQVQMDHAYKVRPDMAEHIWGGKPKSQDEASVMSRVDVRAAMNRDIVNPIGQIEIGVDVARFGDDSTQIYKRKGMKIVDHKELNKADTQFVAKEVWNFAGKDPSIAIKIDDTGLGGGVTDRLKEFGAKTIPINFASNAGQKDKYTSVIGEMWFEFDIDKADIPDDDDLMDQLSQRRYDYDKQGRYIVEAKKDFKKRYGASPDKADALLLTYYQGKSIMFSNDIRAQMAARRARGH